MISCRTGGVIKPAHLAGAPTPVKCLRWCESKGGHPAGRALGGVIDAIRQSSEDGTWLRLKVCARDTCRWAFYDASRNQVRRWCSMAGCGNAMKMKRAYAARKSRAAAERSRRGRGRPPR